MGELVKKLFAEIIGTAILVFFGCGVGISTSYKNTRPFEIGSAFGALIVACAYSIGNTSGCHLNPAVSIALAIRKIIAWDEFGYYAVSQFIGGLLGAFLLGLVQRFTFSTLGGNEISSLLMKENFQLDFLSYLSAFLVEIILTFVFVFAIIGVTDKKYHDGKHAGIVIGISLALVHFLGGFYTGPSVNPARSFGPALLQFLGGNKNAIKQIWIFLIAPMIGGAIAPIVYGILVID